MTYVLPPRRSAQHRGCPVQSRSLRLAVLGWQGERTTREAALALGLSFARLSEWLRDDGAVLPDAFQEQLRTHPEIAAKLAFLRAKGVIS